MVEGNHLAPRPSTHVLLRNQKVLSKIFAHPVPGLVIIITIGGYALNFPALPSLLELRIVQDV